MLHWVWMYRETTVSDRFDTEEEAKLELAKNLSHCNYSGAPGCVDLGKHGKVKYTEIQVQMKFGGSNGR